MTEERIPKFHKYEDSVFTKILTIQDEEKKEVDNLKRMQPFVLRTKIREFESYVRKNHKPKHLLQKDNKSSI